jgi:hypothetical protein
MPGSYDPLERRRGGDERRVVLLLGKEGSAWIVLLLLVVVPLLVPPLSTRLFKDGTGGSVGRESIVVDTFDCVLLLEEGNKGAGLPACENTIHPPRKDARLVIAIQIRRLIFTGFIMLFL